MLIIGNERIKLNRRKSQNFDELNGISQQSCIKWKRWIKN